MIIAARDPGLAELRAARGASAGALAAVLMFSVFVNLLMLTGPLYMLQIYDRVLGSQSEETLVALTGLVAFLFLCMGLLDHVRCRVMARVGARFQDRLHGRVFRASVRRLALYPGDAVAAAGQRDLEAVQRFLASPVQMALADLPWTALFIAAIFVFHPLLGWLAVGGGVLLIGVALLNQRLTQAPMQRANAAALAAERFAESLKSESEAVQALGMAGAGFQRWQKARRAALERSITSADLIGLFSAISRSFRLFLQSAMLGLGAWLVLQGELTAGAMIAGSILLGRALQPIEVAVGQWAVVQRAEEGWGRLATLLTLQPERPQMTALPRPRALLDVQGLTVVPPGDSRAVLRVIGFRLEPGQALGVIGPSGSGKSTLARALIGAWPVAGGKVRLDGATLDQYDPDVLGGYVGYLPQRVTLFDGTIADNIARLAEPPDAALVVSAARRAAAHEMILALPDGYDTNLQALGGRLSGGQIQRIGLARALYGAPLLLVLDEPNSNLDNDGSQALNQAVRAMKAAGGAILIMAHRPAAIQECDLLLVLEGGTRRAFGPRDQVLREMVKNHAEIVASPALGGVR
ncbi:MAG: type I secretion system permease/ATPase [Phaeovulum sp.]|uniref:type I secretion system permease/ATPase n=1 Tax=Phaeovulum sp. TaxID=2934796 RepID=UPI00272F1AE1|nr:type I secretion system permease/ATPase [Phaeovulum sp.]MDP2062744.1 type I secretion system permease/ATPase [Phaeovulum sp.]